MFPTALFLACTVVIQAGDVKAETARSIIAVLDEVKSEVDFTIVDADVRKDDVILYGVLYTPESDKLKLLAKLALEKADLKNVPTQVDVSMMRLAVGQTTPRARIQQMNQLMADMVPRGKLSVLQYDIVAGLISIYGVVPNEADGLRLEEALLRLPGIKKVVRDDLLVFESRPASNVDGLLSIGKVVGALRKGLGQEVVALSAKLIRSGSMGSSVWYLRAAGHLMIGNDYLAQGDVLIAGPESERFALLTSFQGSLRTRLERMVHKGAIIGPVENAAMSGGGSGTTWSAGYRVEQTAMPCPPTRPTRYSPSQQ